MAIENNRTLLETFITYGLIEFHRVYKLRVYFFITFLVDTYTWPSLGLLILLFWIYGDVSSGFQIHIQITEANMLYFLSNPPLVLHLLTSSNNHMLWVPNQYICIDLYWHFQISHQEARSSRNNQWMLFSNNKAYHHLGHKMISLYQSSLKVLKLFYLKDRDLSKSPYSEIEIFEKKDNTLKFNRNV